MEMTVDIDLQNARTYSFSNETGDARIIIYNVFPGIEVSFISVHMEHFDFKQTEKERLSRHVGLYYCKEGRIEQEADNEFFYLMPGDCFIVMQDRHIKKYYFPMKHYRGISIDIDTSIAFDSAANLFGVTDLAPLEVVNDICGDRHSAILRNSPLIDRIFTDIYTVKKELRPGYLKIKLLELLYILKYTGHPGLGNESATVPRNQAELVKRIAKHISLNINDKISVKDLTFKFGVSDTYLQNSFRSVYGMPVISFIRAQKMQCAAQTLIHTCRSVDDIAQEFGYENESKFSAAFKKIMGDSPSIYRKEHSKVRIL